MLFDDEQCRAQDESAAGVRFSPNVLRRPVPPLSFGLCPHYHFTFLMPKMHHRSTGIREMTASSRNAPANAATAVSR